MAYYLILAFFPFLIFLMALIGYTPISSERVLDGLLRILPWEAYPLVHATIWEAVNTKTGSLAPISGGLALWLASNGIGSIITGLNKAYDEKEKRSFLKVKFISIFFTLLLSLAIIFSFILLVFGGIIKKGLIDGRNLTNIYGDIWDIGRYIFIFFVVLMIFATLYRYIPSRAMRWREVIPGALFSALGWLGTSLGFAYYVDNFGNYSIFYGSIGGIAILLIWLYLSAVIILIGGEFNAALGLKNQEKS